MGSLSLKGAGKVCQITACDPASSYGVVCVLPARSAKAATHFLRKIPLRRRGGRRVCRLLI